MSSGTLLAIAKTNESLEMEDAIFQDRLLERE